MCNLAHHFRLICHHSRCSQSPAMVTSQESIPSHKSMVLRAIMRTRAASGALAVPYLKDTEDGW